VASVIYRRIEPPGWQAYGGPVGWWMAVGDRENFCSISARPFQNNDRVRLDGNIEAASDNNGNQITTFRVVISPNANPPVGGGGLIRVTAAVVGP
jgi:hypothetical protein